MGSNGISVEDTNIEFLVGTTKEGEVLLDFLEQRIDHLKMRPADALELAEAIIEAATQASKYGRIIETSLNFNRGN